MNQQTSANADLEKRKVTFGVKSYGKPTPAGIGTLLDFIAAFLAGVFVPAVTAAQWIPSLTSQVLVFIAGILAGGCLLGKRFFGVEVVGKNVPTEQVEQIKNP